MKNIRIATIFIVLFIILGILNIPSFAIQYEGYEVKGTIEIPEINLEYPVLDIVTKNSLEVAVAIAYGPGLNQMGNTVIYGHNYENGTLFSDLDKLENGSKIYLTDSSNRKFEYEVYNTYTTTSSDVSYFTRDTEVPEISLQTSSEGGESRFIVWAKKIGEVDTNGTDINKQWGESDNENQESNTNDNWTDFTNAKVNVEQLSDIRKYKITIPNNTYDNKHSYYYAVGDGTNTPEFSSNLPQLRYDSAKKCYYSGNEISDYLELGKEQYVYVYEHYLNDNSEYKNKLVLDKVKLNKPAQKKYTDVFYATYLGKTSSTSNNEVQILFDTPWGDNTVRKIHLRIGKISNDTILKDIHDKKSNAFENLLNYAKTANAFYDKELNSNTNAYFSAGGIKTSDSNTLFDLNNINKDDYYFLYAVVEDENGKFVKTEGVTFARAGKSATVKDNYSLFFYGSDNFTWKNFSGNTNTQVPTNTSNTVDPTVATQVLPNTGIGFTVLISIISVLLVAIYNYKQYKKNNF